MYFETNCATKIKDHTVKKENKFEYIANHTYYIGGLKRKGN